MVRQRSALWATFLFSGLLIGQLYLQNRTKTAVEHQTPETSSMAFHVRRQKQLRLWETLAIVNVTGNAAPPAWVQDYIAWHASSMQSLTAENWKHHKFLISRCLEIDRACGGVSDRLKSLPVLLLLAAQSQRLLLFYWSRPAALEEFLVPTTALNWSVPHYVPVKGAGTRLYTKLSTLVKAALESKSSVPVLCARLQDQHGGSDYYNAHVRNHTAAGTERAFRTVFRSLFFTIFAPSPAVQYQLANEMILSGLLPGQYKAAHLRAYYNPDRLLPDGEPHEQRLQERAVNAVRCASRLPSSSSGSSSSNTTTTILFVSDSSLAVQHVHRTLVVVATPPNRPAVVVTHRRQDEPLHLDQAESIVAADYVNVFVDLLLLAHARCISHGQGGFGRFGVLLSRDPTCFYKYIDAGRYRECPWSNDDP